MFYPIDTALFIVRVAVGIIFIRHGVPKLKNPAGLASAIGMPPYFPLALGAVELLSGLSLIFGFYVPLAALALAAVMVGAIYFKIAKWNVPFFAQNTTGWEFDFILLAACLALLVSGGGMLGITAFGY